MMKFAHINTVHQGLNQCYHLIPVIFRLTSRIYILNISCEIALRWMPQDLTDDKSILVQVMAWYSQATGLALLNRKCHHMVLVGHSFRDSIPNMQYIIKHIEAETKLLHFADNIFKCIFLNEYVWISLKISLKFVPKVRINNPPALVQIMAWRRPGDKPLSEPIMVSLLTHLCVTQPQWVNCILRLKPYISFH